MAIKIGLTPPHPGAYFRDEWLGELKISIAEAARLLDVRTATLSDLVNEKSAMSADMAARIEAVFGENAEHLMNMQARLDTMIARERAAKLKLKRFAPAA